MLSSTIQLELNILRAALYRYTLQYRILIPPLFPDVIYTFAKFEM